jgi:hypothetical protein
MIPRNNLVSKACRFRQIAKENYLASNSLFWYSRNREYQNGIQGLQEMF